MGYIFIGKGFAAPISYLHLSLHGYKYQEPIKILENLTLICSLFLLEFSLKQPLFCLK